MGGWVTSHNLETRSINEASGARGASQCLPSC